MENTENKKNSNNNNMEKKEEEEILSTKEKKDKINEDKRGEKISIINDENENEILKKEEKGENDNEIVGENKELNNLISENINDNKEKTLEIEKKEININDLNNKDEEKIEVEMLGSDEKKIYEEKKENKTEEIKTLVNEEKEKDENEIIHSDNKKEEEIENKTQNEIKENSVQKLDNKTMEKILHYTESNYKEFIQEKHFCDYNTGEEWLPGYILSISKEGKAIIADILNPNNSKKIINLNDRKNIAYIRKYSSPDNNMAKVSQKNLKNKLNQFIGFHNDFDNYMKNCSNFDFYYFLRVTVYYGLDFGMNGNISTDNVYISFKLILTILDIIVDCLKFIEKNLKDFLNFEVNIKNTELVDLVLLEKKYAIFSFFDDIHFLLKKIFADSPQYLDWYINFKKEINKFNPALNTQGDIDTSKYNIPLYKNGILKKICVNKIYDNVLHLFYTLDKEINSSIIAYFVDYFSYRDGFKILFKLIYSINIINETNFKNIFDIQIKLIKDLFLVKAITNAFNNSHDEEKQNLDNYINNYLNKLDENIYEKVGKKEFFDFFNKIFDLIEKDEDKKAILKEKVVINFNFNKFLSEKKLDKRIFYLTEINNIITSTEYNELSTKIFSSKKNKDQELNEAMLNDIKFKDRNKDIKIMTCSQFCKICHEKNIINFILSNNSHEEIIKRLYPVLKIMYLNNFGFEENQVGKIDELKDGLFKALFHRLKEVEKNNEILWKIIQEMIINFTECLLDKDKFKIFLLIKNYFMESMNTKGNKHPKINNIFNLLVNFSLKSLGKINEEEEIKNISEEKFYCLDILLQFLVDKKRLDELNLNLTKEQKIEIINLSITGIVDILVKADFNSKLISIVIGKIMTTIFNLSNITQNINLLEQLTSKNVIIKETIDELCSKKTDEEMINLINELIDAINSNKEDELYETKFKTEKILDFIFMLFQSTKYIKQGYDKINLIDILYSSNGSLKKIFNEKLNKNLPLIKYEIKIYIFDNILINPKSSFKIKDLQSYQILKEFIINLNTLSNKFNFITEKDFIVVFEKINEIFGYEKLFQILLSNENNEIQKDIQDLISDIYLRVKFSSREKYKNFWNEIGSGIINELKKLILGNNNNQNNPGIKGIIGLLKKIIEKSNNDGEIIKNKQIINGMMDKVKNNLKEKEKDSNNNSIKVLFNYNYYKEDENDNKNIIGKNKNDEQEIKVKEIINMKKECELYPNEFFYYLRYELSYEFAIPLKCVEISIPYQEDDSLTLNLFEDYFLVYETIKSYNFPNLKKNEQIIINVKKIINPLDDPKNANIKNIIKSNKELLSLLRDLLKKRNCNITSDILEIVKDDDDFIKRGIFDDFNKLINGQNINPDLLNELFNFSDASIFYKNLILSNLYEFLKKDDPNIISKLIKSDIWEKKLKNIDIKNINKENNKNESLAEKKYINNIINIYIKIANELKNDKDITIIKNIELIATKIFEIYYMIINDCIKKDFDSEEIKFLCYEIVENINELFKKNESVSIAFVKYILNEKEKMFNDIKFCFVDGVLKNKFPFINNKIQEFIINLMRQNAFDENKEDINDIRNNFYLFISSIFFDKGNNTSKYVIESIFEFFKNMKNDIDNIYIYNIKSYYYILSEILFITYNYISKEINFENYIIEFVIPYIYEPLIKKSNKYSTKLNDIYFGTQCKILYNYIQLIDKDHISKDKYDSIFNYKGKDLKKYLFEEIIMLNCDRGSYKTISELKKSLQIYHSSKEANHLFILLLIKDGYNNDLRHYLEKIKFFNTLNYWFGDQVADWKLNYHSNERQSTSDFIGLKNLGCTCYMNSLMQTFYNIIPLRESFLRLKIEQKTKNSLYEVQKLFFSLKFCKEKYYTPASFVENYDNEKLSIHQQMDIDEFFSNLMDKLENRLKNTNNENIIKYFFQGRINDVLTFQEGCTHHRTNISNFYSIQLQIRNKKSLYESLDTLIEGELMNEDNCIFCPDCNKKMPAVKSQNFKTLPRMLIFVLKRFEFDFNTMNRIKINDYYEFPIDLNMNKYTSEYLNNKESNNNNKYKLKSIVIHQGHCGGGHYYAFIRDNTTQEWHQFNDTSVTEFDIKDIPKEAFGGNTNKNAYLLFYEKEDMSNCEKFDKIEEIDLLENIKENEENENDDDNNDNNMINKDNNTDNEEEGFNLIKENEIKNEIKTEINNENGEEKKEKNDEIYVGEITDNIGKKIFSKDYHHLTLELYLNVLNMIDPNKTKDLLSNENHNVQNNTIPPIEKQFDLIYKPKHFCQNISKYYKEGKIKIFNYGKESKVKSTEEEIEEKNTKIFEYILLNYFNVVIRSENRKYLGCYVDLMKALVNKYEYCANYLLEEFTQYNVIMEYLKNCPLYEIKKLTVGIIDYAMNTSINYFQKNKDKIKDKKKHKKVINENQNANIDINENLNIEELNKINEDLKALKSDFQKLTLEEKKPEKIPLDFEVVGDEEISKLKEMNEINDFEVIEKEKISQAKLEKAPITKHYLDIMKEENQEKTNISEMNNDDNLLIKNNLISEEVINMIYNIIYVMKKIKFENYIESRFLFAVLLKFSQISFYTQNFLITNIKILLALNILLFKNLIEKNYTYREVFDIGQDYIKSSEHHILNPQPGKRIQGEFDKFKNINLKYDFLLLFSLSYEKEVSLEDSPDSGFSFYNKNYILGIIKKIDTKQELNYLCNLIKKKCFNNKDLFKTIFDTAKIVIERINDSEDAFYDKFEQENYSEIFRNTKKPGSLLKRLRCILHILLINLFELKGDNFTEYRQKEIFNGLFDLFKDNKRYYSYTIYIINIIIDIYLRGGEFVKKRMKQILEVKDWLEKNKIAPKLYQIRGIEMYKDTPIHPSLYIDLKNISEVNQKL